MAGILEYYFFPNPNTLGTTEKMQPFFLPCKKKNLSWLSWLRLANTHTNKFEYKLLHAVWEKKPERLSLFCKETTNNKT